MTNDKSPRSQVLRTLTEEGQRLALRRRNGTLELLLGNVVLLSSAALETERVFGRLASDVVTTPEATVVVGGLGFGSTLRGVLEIATPSTRIVVVEKLAAVIDVARTEAAELLAGALDDPRVTIANDDVAAVIERLPAASVAAILLDVDNGPEWASFRGNARLYSPTALAVAKSKLAPGGIFAVWSGYAKDAFVAELRRAGFEAKIVPITERGTVRARAYVGTLPPAPFDASSAPSPTLPEDAG